MGLSVVSLFAGIGGLDLGFQREGFDIVWANELLPNAAAGYRSNIGHDVIVGDIDSIGLTEIPRADVVIGGPPCQSFSLVGKRQPDDVRGRLVFRFVDVIDHIRPKAFVMENVPGMAASRIEGRRLTDILTGAFEVLGYRVTRMALVATDFLVPQLRRRVFLVGHRDVLVSPPNPRAFVSERLGVNDLDFDVSAHAAIGDLGECVAKGERAAYRIEPRSSFSRLMRSAGAETVSLHECPRMSPKDQEIVAHVPPGGNFQDVPDAIATQRILNFKATGGRTTTYGRLHPDRPSHTINTYFRRPNVGTNFHYSEDRLITPREAMRFQSLPDHFELVFGSQDERNAQIGNAVPPFVAQAVAWAISTAAVSQRKPHQQELGLEWQPIPADLRAPRARRPTHGRR